MGQRQSAGFAISDILELNERHPAGLEQPNIDQGLYSHHHIHHISQNEISPPAPTTMISPVPFPGANYHRHWPNTISPPINEQGKSLFKVLDIES